MPRHAHAATPERHNATMPTLALPAHASVAAAQESFAAAAMLLLSPYATSRCQSPCRFFTAASAFDARYG